MHSFLIQAKIINIQSGYKEIVSSPVIDRSLVNIIAGDPFGSPENINEEECMHSAAVFIDAGYLEKIVSKRYSGFRIDYSKLSDAVKDERDEILRTYYYNCPPYQSPEPTPEERRRKSGYDRFRQVLLRLPRFEVREGKTVKRSETEFGQKGVDTLICVDMVKLVYSGKIDKVILIAGDHDLMPGIEAVKDAMVITKLIFHKESVSNQLYEMCDDRMMIDDELVDNMKRE